LNTLPESAQIVLGAYALADTHTLSAGDIVSMSSGAIAADQADDAMQHLVDQGLAVRLGNGVYQLTKEGIAVSLEMQSALAERAKRH
jgi:hypothetical protein